MWLLCFPLRKPEGQGCNRSSHTRSHNISAQQAPWAQPPSLHLHPMVHMLVPAWPLGAPHPARPRQGSLRWLRGTGTTEMPAGPFLYSGAQQRCTHLRRCLPTPGPQRTLPARPVPAGGGNIKNSTHPQVLLRCCCLLVRRVMQALLISLQAEALPLCVITLLGSCLLSASCCAEPLPPVRLLRCSSSPASQGSGAGNRGSSARR